MCRVTMISVLYVDDEPDLLEVVRLYLERTGEFDVTTSTSAQKALSGPAIRSCDAIISDYQMPGMDGIMFLKAVREQFGDLPFILFTGRGREEVVIEAINNGADFYMQKGGDTKALFAELSHKIRQAVRRRQAEATLAEQEQRYHDLQNASDLIQSVAPDGRILFANKKWLETLGYTEEDLPSLKIFDIIHEESIDHCRDMFQRVCTGESVGLIDAIFKRRDGEKVYVEGIAGSRIVDGVCQYTRGLFKDITDRKQMEAELAESHDFLCRIYASVQSGILVVDAQTHEIIDLNPAAANMMGTTRDRIVGKVCHQFICPTERGRCPITDLHKELDNSERTLLTVDGRQIDIIKDVVPVNFNGRECLLETFLDNTERKRAANNLHAAYKKVSAAKEELCNYDLLCRKEQTLRESNESFRAVVEQSNEGIVIVDLTGKLLYANRRAAEIVESAEDLDPSSGINVLDFVALEFRESAISSFRKVAEGHDSILANTRIVTLAGRDRCLEWIGRKISFRGSPTMLLSLVDVTGRMCSGEELRDSEYKFATVFQNNPVPLILTSTPGGVFIDVNDAFLQSTGYARADVIGKTAMELELFADHDEGARFISTLLEKCSVQNVEVLCRNRIGENRICRFSSNMIRIGGMSHILLVVEDITEYKQAQEAIRESGERYRLIMENASDGILINGFTPEGPGKFIDINESACRILGVTREESQSMNLIDLNTPDMHERVPETMQELMENGRTAFQITYPTKNGRESILNVSTSLFDLDGEPTILTVIRDTTEQRAAESALHALVAGMVGTTGMESLDRIAESINAWLLADCIMIGELTPDREHIRVLSMLLDGKKISGYSYALKGTPCENTARNGFCLFPDNAAQLFPESRDLFEFNIRGYAGTTLRNTDGQVVGILCILSRAPINLPPFAREIIEIIAAKAAAEIGRMNALKALSESEEKFRALVEHSLDGTLILDPGGTILFANHAAGRFIGIEDSGDLLGERNVIEFIAPASRGDVIRDFGEVAKGTDGYVARYKILTVAEEERWVESLGRSIAFNGAPSILISLRDITERKRAEEALRKSEEMLALVMNSIPTYLAYADTELRIVYINKPHAAWLGHPGDALIGKNLKELLPEDVFARAFPYQKMVLAGREVTFENSNRGHVLAVHLIPHIQEGRVVGFFAALNDITERKRMEEALKESEARFHSMFERHGSIMLLVEPATMRIIDANLAAERFYGKTKDELSSLTLQDFNILSPRAVPAETGGVGDTFFVSSHRAAGGEIRVVEVHSSPIALEGRTVLFSIISDITEKKRAEDTLKQVNKKLNLLSSITRHDIKNQLQVLSGYAALLCETHSDPASANYLSCINTASNQIESMIRFAREYEEVGVHLPAWQDLRALVNDAGESANLDGVVLENEIPVGTEIFTDPLIIKVFFNLIDNALRYGRKITTIRFASESRGGDCTVICEDDGDGIEDRLKERIFGRGFGKNTGFGLFLSREILDITGITIKETGKAGRGARFEIAIPQGQWRVRGE